MCGLLGFLNLRADIETARSLMAQRGPDGVTAEQIDNVTLCHGRLAIVGRDLPATVQPLHDRGFTAIYNGYISNFAELNERLKVTTPAAECLALICGYSQCGIAGLVQLQGQFAAAIVDRDRRVLILARDPMGICPLYYARFGSNGLMFASQAAWILQDGLVDSAPRIWQLNEQSLAQLQSFAYVLPDETLIAEIHQVPPGSAIEFSLDDGSLTTTYNLAPSSIAASVSANADSFRDAIHDSVKRNLVGDTHPWLLLSGGLDSLIVLHCAVAAGVRPHAITLSYLDRENAAEVAMALEMARYYGCTPHVAEFPRSLAQISAELFRGRVDWPLDGGSLLPKVCLANEIRARSGRIVLGGTGADELFGGYRRHVARLEMTAERPLDLAAERTYYRQWIANESDNDAVFEWFCATAATDRFADPAFIYDLLEMQQQHNPRVDSCFANVGVEYRPVFQDATIVRQAGSLPLSEKTEIRARKSLLRRAFAREIPSRFLEVPKSPLRFADMGPTRRWRERVLAAWLESRRVHLGIGGDDHAGSPFR
jgi:asparagine synthase (glutamine-hydrolysing)